MGDDSTNDDNQFQINNPDDTNPIEDMKQDEQLPQDGATPFSPPAGIQDQISDVDPPTDTGIDATQRYDAGIQEAANVEPPSESAVVDFNPPSPVAGDDESEEQQPAA